jgi:hypothetical protein
MNLERMDSHTIKEPGKYFCWLSGWRESNPPSNWYAPWWLQIAHIASGSGVARRVNDRRAVVLLCPICHMVHVSDSDKHSSMVINGKRYPTIDERHTLYIKQQMDPVHYSPEYLSEVWIGRVPEPEKPHDFWCEQFMQSTGIFRS